MTLGDQVVERYKPDQPAVHLCGIGLDGEVGVEALVVLADADAAMVDVEPSFGGARSGEDEMDDGAGLRKPCGDGVLVHTPDEGEPGRPRRSHRRTPLLRANRSRTPTMNVVWYAVSRPIT